MVSPLRAKCIPRLDDLTLAGSRDVQAADVMQNKRKVGMCDDVRMEYRYPVGRLVADSLMSLIPLLVSAFLMVAIIMFLVDPPASGSHGIRGGGSALSSSA